jgi:hypothetical protein
MKLVVDAFATSGFGESTAFGNAGSTGRASALISFAASARAKTRTSLTEPDNGSAELALPPTPSAAGPLRAVSTAMPEPR